MREVSGMDSSVPGGPGSIPPVGVERSSRRSSLCSPIRVGRTYSTAASSASTAARAEAREGESRRDPDISGGKGRGTRGEQVASVTGLLVLQVPLRQAAWASASSMAWCQYAMAHSGEALFWKPPRQFSNKKQK